MTASRWRPSSADTGGGSPRRGDEVSDLVDVSEPEHDVLGARRRRRQAYLGRLVPLTGRKEPQAVAFQLQIALRAVDLQARPREVVRDRGSVRRRHGREGARAEPERHDRRVLVVLVATEERGGPRLDGGYRAREPEQQVEEMDGLRRQDPACGEALAASPRRASGRVARQAAGVKDTAEEHPAERSVGDGALRPDVVGEVAVVHDEPQRDSVPVARGDHLVGAPEIDCERLLAQDVLPGLGRRQRGFCMEEVR